MEGFRLPHPVDLYTSSLMVKQRTPNSQDERSSRSAYAIISSVSSAGRTARLGREGQVFKSPTGELSGIGTAATALALGARNHRRFESFIPDY